jgi:hypothetical protein
MMGLLVAVGSMSLSACALTCGARADKLAALQRGMSYDEATRVMGCSGTVVSRLAPANGTYSTVEWNGPKDYFFTRTQLDFLDGRLLSYTTDKRGAL